MKQTRLPQDERREQIIKTSMQIINEEGYAAFTTRRLAEKIGISEPALYRHFNSKDDIIIKILEKMGELWSDINEELDRVDDLEKKLCHFVMMHFRYIEENPDILAVLFADEYLRLNDNLRKMLFQVTDQRYYFLYKLLKGGIKSGEIRGTNPIALAIIIVGAIRTTALNWRNSNYSYSLSEFGEYICTNLTNMILSSKQ
ncbi:MAG: TetR/AcrR family transcriptional regulator [Candidatus Cloacimonetes bacterium]|nr:TetR/AcrR family transcriptional regulator [Candidatus Cloacimonadota bacterium]